MWTIDEAESELKAAIAELYRAFGTYARRAKPVIAWYNDASAPEVRLLDSQPLKKMS